MWSGWFKKRGGAAKMRVVFIQNCSLGDVCGGAKILRSVVEKAPVPVSSITTAFGRTGPLWGAEESWVPIRPGLGKLDHTRFAWLGGYVEALLARRFARRLEAELRRLQATDVHLIPHSWGDFIGGMRAAGRLDLRVHMSIHDDFQYTAGSHVFLRRMERALGTLWREARTRFVITEEMGCEYDVRYGQRDWLVHTDGATCADAPSLMPVDGELRFYFMGLLLNGYMSNFESLIEGLSRLSQSLGMPCRLTMRSRGLPMQREALGVSVEVLPYTTQDVLNKEMAAAHFLYLPLPFEAASAKFNRFSLSTKMVSYMGTGTPIIYHGPADSAAAGCLRRSEAALMLHTTDPDQIMEPLRSAVLDPAKRMVVANKSLAAARSEFSAQRLFDRFWNAVAT